jgi:hypothetical protein
MPFGGGTYGGTTYGGIGGGPGSTSVFTVGDVHLQFVAQPVTVLVGGLAADVIVGVSEGILNFSAAALDHVQSDVGFTTGAPAVNFVAQSIPIIFAVGASCFAYLTVNVGVPVTLVSDIPATAYLTVNVGVPVTPRGSIVGRIKSRVGDFYGVAYLNINVTT